MKFAEMMLVRMFFKYFLLKVLIWLELSINHFLSQKQKSVVIFTPHNLLYHQIEAGTYRLESIFYFLSEYDFSFLKDFNDEDPF